ncbi:glycosyltransferase family 2 protein [Parabacteroides sp. OttesenSCG-928-G07]|nr:glycosyltransferase family 2 protein [Parabacteroides sp. OttesenSCG-928-G21]MDL2277995.1 glycosyltransferase family 2 protein [Parabacteroides sp. OttesenSCG-928-G07]
MEQYFYMGSEWLQKNEYAWTIGEAILFLLFLISVLYLFIFAIFSLRKRKFHYPEAKKRYRFAVLFPAYKEDSVIINSVKSFFGQNYPRELYDIIVISDQMTQATNQALEDLSARVVEISLPNSSKTNALRKAMTYIEDENLQYDVVVIMDADNIVDPDYLDKINDAFYSGCAAVQTHRVAKNRNTSVAVLDAVSEEINNSIFRKGHTRLGFSSALMGSGMAFDYELFKESIFKAGHVGVDKQLEMILLKQNIYIEYLEDVYTYDEKVANKTSFYQQRRRWLATQFTNLFSGIFSMPMAMLRGNWDYCNKLFQWMMLPRVILFGFIVLLALLFTWLDWMMSIKWWGLLLLLCITFSIAVPDYLVDKKLRNAILSLPVLFILMFFNFFRLKGATKEFIHTEHKEN